MIGSGVIDIRIFGVPERMPCIEKNKLLLDLPGENIFIDERHDGCLKTARRAWSKQTDRPYTLVLQDDVELCDGFIGICETMIKVHPDVIFSLFPMQFIRRVPGSKIPTVSPYIQTKDLTAQGILMKTEYVAPCLASWDDSIPGDDTNIQRWAEKQGIIFITTIPPVLQHIGDVSVYDPSRSPGRSPFYVQRPIGVNWECGFVTPWSNLVRW